MAAALLAGCGAGAPEHAARTAAVHDGRGPVPTGHDLARRVAAASRVGLRRLAVATGATGESGDAGQLVVTGVVDRVACDARRRCVVRWIDATGGPHRTAYRVAPAANGCFVAVATPALPSIRDVTTNAPAEDPMQQLLGAPC